MTCVPLPPSLLERRGLAPGVSSLGNRLTLSLLLALGPALGWRQYTHFTNEGTKAQGDEVTCLRSAS